jgi:hypothetical protein
LRRDTIRDTFRDEIEACYTGAIESYA